jgi:thiol-disulfide isomerase/thioredoxin
MTYLFAAVTALAVVCLLNLVLVLGVLRRLRMTEDAAGGAHRGAFTGLRVGTRPEPFVVRSLDGGRLTEAEFAGAGPTLIGFFSPGCGPCTTQAPLFAARAAAWPGGPDRVLVVIVDDTEEAAAFAEPFVAVARVVVDGLPGAVATAFAVTAFPSFGVLDDAAMVRAEATRVDALPAAPAVPAAA